MRNSAIELLRVIMMLGIVACHVIGQGGHDNHLGIDRICGCGVVGFMFISGYYGMKCSVKRISRLLGIALYCNFIVAGLGVLSEPSVSYWDVFLYNWTHGSGWWFLWGYLIVMLLSPLIEAAFSTRRLDFVVSVCILVFGWQFATAVPFLRNVIPVPNGFGGLSFVMLLGIYVFARACSCFEWLRHLPRRTAMLAFAISAVFVAIGFSQYSSPAALLLGASAFSIALSFERTPLYVGKVCRCLVPSLFSVYLIHTNIQGFELISRMEDYFFDTLNIQGGGYLLVICIVFCAGIIIDLPRRLCVSLADRLINR